MPFLRSVNRIVHRVQALYPGIGRSQAIFRHRYWSEMPRLLSSEQVAESVEVQNQIGYERKACQNDSSHSLHFRHMHKFFQLSMHLLKNCSMEFYFSFSYLLRRSVRKAVYTQIHIEYAAFGSTTCYEEAACDCRRCGWLSVWPCDASTDRPQGII